MVLFSLGLDTGGRGNIKVLVVNNYDSENIMVC